MADMSKLRRRLCYRLKIKSSAKIASEMGVHIGSGCRFLDDPTKMFGNSPYLIRIGNHVELTHGVKLVTHDGGAWCLREKPEYKDLDFFGPITIGNNCYIGINSIVLPNVKIGNNVIIGACSVVTKDIPDNTVCAGVPARVVKTMDEYEQKAAQTGFNTKHLSEKEKETALRQMKPEWFS